MATVAQGPTGDDDEHKLQKAWTMEMLMNHDNISMTMMNRPEHGLPQSGILAEKQLIHFLGNYGYSLYNTLLAFGATNGTQSASALLWMTLA